MGWKARYGSVSPASTQISLSQPDLNLLGIFFILKTSILRTVSDVEYVVFQSPPIMTGTPLLSDIAFARLLKKDLSFSFGPYMLTIKSGVPSIVMFRPRIFCSGSL